MILSWHYPINIPSYRIPHLLTVSLHGVRPSLVVAGLLVERPLGREVHFRRDLKRKRLKSLVDWSGGIVSNFHRLRLIISQSSINQISYRIPSINKSITLPYHFVSLQDRRAQGRAATPFLEWMGIVISNRLTLSFHRALSRFSNPVER